MGWKSIEMQVALPRTQDAGQLQEQMMKQNQHFQASLAQSQLKENIKKRNSVQLFEDIHDIKRNDEGRHQQGYHTSGQHQDPDEPSIKHPYLGRQIDFSG